MTDNENRNSGKTEEKYGDRSVRIESPLSERLSDFWFHHKGKVIAAVILLLVVILTVSQCVGRRNNDVMVAYSGSGYLTGADVEEIQNLLSVLYARETGDEDALIGMTQYLVYSKEQIESMRAETDADGEHHFVNSELNSENYDALYEYVMTGDTAILFLESWLYGELLKNDRLVPMSELFGTVPPSVDEKGYGIMLGETEIYSYYGVMQKMPANTVVCFLKPYAIHGNTSNDKKYEAMKDVFRMIATFEAPQ